ncbi:MAG: type II toxin-antitoxin system HicB family antitoxin [Candidatus Pacebacteria bacterium]|nr:type II toxin-antitoxin system HicB family antitoxin [Candidatus Paceibacterota bacterium]
MKSIIQFQISKEGNYYTASGVDLPVVTQAKTLDELTRNIKEAVNLHLEGEDLTEYNLTPKPSVLINFELPNKVYA